MCGHPSTGESRLIQIQNESAASDKTRHCLDCVQLLLNLGFGKLRPRFFSGIAFANSDDIGIPPKESLLPISVESTLGRPFAHHKLREILSRFLRRFALTEFLLVLGSAQQLFLISERLMCDSLRKIPEVDFSGVKKCASSFNLHEEK
jgi:hypothetical protein